MILGFWNNVHLRCGIHTDFDMCETSNTFGYTTYNCTNPICKNNLRTDDVEKAIEYLSDMIYTDDGDLVYLKNLKWMKRGILYKVIEQKDDVVTLLATNKKNLI